ncbi:MAG: DUF3857 domain-containing transglutaminase family protein [Cytophagales bacterium]|nr:DUF3857 domain-containing transglutaminase family protein [Cytophagales bacterium]
MRICAFLFFVATNFCQAKDEPKYPVSQIPEELKKGMYAVVRESHERFEILSVKQSRYYLHKVITIFNGEARRYAEEYIGYDKMEKINFINAKVYNAQGDLIKKLKSNEIADRSAFDGFSLFSDNRLKEFDLAQVQYPYTVDIEYEVEKNYLYSIPSFELYFDDEVSLQLTTFEISYPQHLKPKYKLFQLAEPKKEANGGNEKLSWRYENVMPEKFEPYMPAQVIPSVIFSPSQFEYAGYAGNMTTWQELGKWQILLNEGRGLLPEQTRSKVRELTKNLPTADAKAKALYEYLQNKTRYVSIQRGIGGFQPFDATTVDKTGYGDCKALSNYMVALLNEAGLKGYYTQIYAGDNNRPIPKDFTIDYFNHIIVAMPNGKDTLWMECTSQAAPFGYLGKFTGNRYALMVTETGGALVRTPRYDQNKNQQVTYANVTLDAQGNAKATVKAKYTGLQFENGNLDYYTSPSTEEQRKWLEKNVHIPSFEIAAFSIQSKKEKIPSAEVSIELNLNRFSSVSGKRLFLTPNLMNRSTYVPEKLEKRKYTVNRTMPYIDLDSITYSIPDVLYPEFTPQPTKVTSRFGEYESLVKFDQGKLIYVRRLKMNSGEFPAESYNELIDFYKTINKADNLKLVFLNKT